MKRIALILALASGACSDPTGPAGRGALETARMRWAIHEPAAYRYTVRRACFCGDVRAVTVTVRNGQVEGAWYADGTDELVPESDPRRVAVEGLFALVEQALTDDADGLDVEYDASFAFPRRINIDWYANAIDDEMYWTATDFTVLP